MASSNQIFYRNTNDVHAYTSDFREALQSQISTFAAKVGKQEWDTCMNKLRHKYATVPEIITVVDKFCSRYDEEIGGYWDGDLSVNVAKVIVSVHNLIEAYDEESIWVLYEQILKDIGTTCIQGDDHRLFSLWIPLMECKQ
jgi:hypothetical protein